jgi:hypothetical protein
MKERKVVLTAAVIQAKVPNNYFVASIQILELRAGREKLDRDISGKAALN